MGAWNEKTIDGLSQLDPEKLPMEAKVWYQDYLEYRKKANQYKDFFEEAMNKIAALPPGQKLVFKYGLGRVQVGIGLVKSPSKRKPPRKSVSTLEEFLKSR